MKPNLLAHTDKGPIIEGVLLGGKFAFSLSVIYTILVSAFIIFTASSNRELNIDQSISDFFLLVSFMCIGGIIPALIIGSISGGLIGFAIAFWNSHITHVMAGFIGFLIQTTLILGSNYLLWFALRSSDNDVPFWEYFLSIRMNLFYLIPSMIGILISPYIGWKINKTKYLDPAEQ